MIEKEKLADLTMGYSINLIEILGIEYCITASEERDGEVLLINTVTKEVKKIEGLSGGVMNLVPIPERPGAFFAIQRFYPIFDSKNAEIVYCEIDTNKINNTILTAKVKTILLLPFVHRIALAGTTFSRKLIAATLCKDKAYQDDWSQTGSVYELSLDNNMQLMGETVLLNDIHKNHGMYAEVSEKTSKIYISGEEGVWLINLSDTTKIIEKMNSLPISDLYMCDLDDDGQAEMACISPFHGDTLQVLKQIENKWQDVLNIDIVFGHALWGGKIAGKPSLIISSRGGHRNTELYQLDYQSDKVLAKKIIVDEGVGAANIVLKKQGEDLILYAANHASNEIVRYIFRV